ncbi:MAG: elongation factor P [Minisyncoccota bacterium]
MLNITEIKAGKKILLHGEPYVVLEYQHSKIGRGGAVMRTRLRNLFSGAILEHTFQGADKIEEAEVSKSHAQYLYREGETYQFMEMETYDQFSLGKDVLGNAPLYMVEGTDVSVVNWNGQPINIEIPVKVTLSVRESPPGLKGDTASGGDKVVIMETGLQVTTPLFVKTDDRLIINTEKGTYVSRV